MLQKREWQKRATTGLLFSAAARRCPSSCSTTALRRKGKKKEEKDEREEMGHVESVKLLIEPSPRAALLCGANRQTVAVFSVLLLYE